MSAEQFQITALSFPVVLSLSLLPPVPLMALRPLWLPEVVTGFFDAKTLYRSCRVWPVIGYDPSVCTCHANSMAWGKRSRVCPGQGEWGRPMSASAPYLNRVSLWPFDKCNFLVESGWQAVDKQTCVCWVILRNKINAYEGGMYFVLFYWRFYLLLWGENERSTREGKR